MKGMDKIMILILMSFSIIWTGAVIYAMFVTPFVKVVGDVMAYRTGFLFALMTCFIWAVIWHYYGVTTSTATGNKEEK